jgi:hypothetical protein
MHRQTRIVSKVSSTFHRKDCGSGQRATGSENSAGKVRRSPVLESLEQRRMFTNSLHLPLAPIVVINPTGPLAIAAEYSATAKETDAFGLNVKSLLGKPTSGVASVPGVTGALVEKFHNNGAIYWSSTTGAHVIYGAIGAKYNAVNGPTLLGLPTTDETTAPDGVGRYNHFESLDGKTVGAIDWTPNNGAHDVHGQVAAQFKLVGWEKIGEATTDEIDIVNSNYTGEYNRFATEAAIKLPFGGSIDVPVKLSSVNWTSTYGGSLTGGPSYTDITQGSNGTCWIDASIAAMEAAGQDVANLITYEGNNTYSVQLNNYNNPAKPSAGTHPETETVVFNGTTLAAGSPRMGMIFPSLKLRFQIASSTDLNGAPPEPGRQK